MVYSDTAPAVKQRSYRLTEPKVLCVIPARGGSKGFPGKNIAPLLGKPLIAHTIEHALGASCITDVYVSTDDNEIAHVSKDYGANVVMRPQELSGDLAPSEWAVRHVANTVPDDYLFYVMLQCTSPIRTSRDIDNAFRLMLDVGGDSLLSVVVAPRFIWKGTQGDARPINYDYRARPMRQYGALGYVENGSIYITKKHILERTGNRLGGRIAMYEMDWWSQFEIDTEDERDLCEWILERELE
jgi:N-acylneuraminate cytidylyltransferase